MLDKPPKEVQFQADRSVHEIFLDGGFRIREGSPTHKDTVLEYGQRAEGADLAFLRERGIQATEGGSVLRDMRKIHRSGQLNDRILAFQLLKTEGIEDSAPSSSVNILAPVSIA